MRIVRSGRTDAVDRALAPRRPPRFRQLRRAAALVELAIVLPLLLMLTFLCVDFGSSVGAYLTLSNATRIGAEYGATHQFTAYSYSSWESHVTDAIRQEMASLNTYSPSRLQITISTSVNGDGSKQIVADARYTFQTVVSWPGVPTTVPMHSRIEMRQYR